MEDRFHITLLESSEKLLFCRDEKELSSCTPCLDWEKCEIRKEYVDAVYKNMSKGQSGGFDF
jgi:hypothetical protein